MKSTPQDENARIVTLDGVLAQVEGEYFFDYATFSGTLRNYVVSALEAQYKTDPNDLHRRAFMLALYREEYTAYEDIGAFLDALLRAAADSSAVPLARIISYGPGDVKLKGVLERHNIATGDDLFKKLGLADWCPASWITHFPEVDLTKVLRRACAFFVEDRGPGQRDTGVLAFNKIKHGLVFVPEGQRYAKSSLPSAPAVIFRTDKKDPSAKTAPVTLLALPTDPDKLEGRLRMIHFSQFGLRILAMLYVLKRYPKVIERRGLKSDASVFASPRMLDVLDFMRKSASTPWAETLP